MLIILYTITIVNPGDINVIFFSGYSAPVILTLIGFCATLTIFNYI